MAILVARGQHIKIGVQISGLYRKALGPKGVLNLDEETLYNHSNALGKRLPFNREQGANSVNT